MANWLQDIGRFIRGDVAYDYRVESPQLSVREAAGENIIKWHKDQPAWLDKDVRKFDTHGYRRTSLIFACVQYLSNAAATAPIIITQHLQNGQEEEVADHPVLTLLNRPNIGQGMGRFISFVTMMAAVTGFAVIEKERNQRGEVIGLWVLRSDWLRPIPKSAGITDWQYTVPGYASPFIIESEDAIPVTYADTITGSPAGIGPLEVIFQEAQILNELDDFIKAFLERGAMPLYIAIPDVEGPVGAQWKKQETVDAWEEKFQQKYGGIGNHSSVLMSPALKDIKPLGFSINELAYTDLRDVSETSITTAFGIPPQLLGTRMGVSDGGKYAQHGAARRSFYEDTMVPWWSRLDDTLTRHLMPEFMGSESMNLQFDFSQVPALQEDEDAKHARAVAAWQSGLISRHTALREAGYDPHGDNVFLMPFSAVQVPVAGGGGVDDTDDAPVRAVPNGSYISPAHQSRYIRRDGRLYANEAHPDDVRARAGANQIVAKRRQLMDKVADLLEPRMETYLRAQGERVIASATNARADVAPFETRAIEAYDWFADEDELLEIMRQWWAEVTEQAFGVVSDELGVDYTFGMHNPFLAEIEGILGYRIRGITETTRKNIEQIVRERLTEGTTMPDLADALNEWLEPTYKNRATTVARSESQVALNTATEKAYAATGQVTHVRMFDNPNCDAPAGSDGLTCPQRNNLVVPLATIQRHIGGEHPNGTMAYAAVIEPLNDDGSIG